MNGAEAFEFAELSTDEQLEGFVEAYREVCDKHGEAVAVDVVEALVNASIFTAGWVRAMGECAYRRQDEAVRIEGNPGEGERFGEVGDTLTSVAYRLEQRQVGKLPKEEGK